MRGILLEGLWVSLVFNGAWPQKKKEEEEESAQPISRNDFLPPNKEPVAVGIRELILSSHRRVLL